MEKNVQDNFLMGLIFRTSRRVGPTKIKIPMGIWIFSVEVIKVSELTGGYTWQILQVFRNIF